MIRSLSRALLFLLAAVASAAAQVADMPAQTWISLINPTNAQFNCCGNSVPHPNYPKVACPFSPTLPNTVTLLFLGESLWGNNVPNDYQSTYTGDNNGTGDICVYSPLDGNYYADGPRLLGPLSDSMAGGCTNNVAPLVDCRDSVARYITNWLMLQTGPLGGRYSHAIIIDVAIGGSQVGFWAAGGVISSHWTNTIANLVAHGITPTAVIAGFGVNDNGAGTSQATYAANMASIISTARAAGLPTTVPWLIPQESALNGATSSAVRAAQAGMVNPSDHIFSGGDVDTIPYTLSYRVPTTCTAVVPPLCTSVGLVVPSPHWNQAGSVEAMVAVVSAYMAAGILQ